MSLDFPSVARVSCTIPRVQGGAFVELFSPSIKPWRHAPARSAMVLRCQRLPGPAVLTDRDGRALQSWPDALDALLWMSTHFDSPEARWIGYLSYDLGRAFESCARRPIDAPIFAFACVTELAGDDAPDHPSRAAPLASNFTRDAYLAAVAQVIEYIHAGDVYQVNLAQRFTTGLSGSPREIWQRLIASTPPLYGAYLDFGDHIIISSSPELFFRIDRDRRITCRPIKGTRPRGPGMKDELDRSTKDQAELAMIVDLVRNDLGRVCEIGSVRVTDPRSIETHPTVYHGVATIEGRLRDEVSFIDILRATFPCGSVTGAPKIRAIQIIDELEPAPRGPYCGAIGVINPDGSMHFSVAIRTMIVRNGIVQIPVGGGIVADSNPVDEYEETLVKARAMFDALGIIA